MNLAQTHVRLDWFSYPYRVLPAHIQPRESKEKHNTFLPI